jgi:hypothetical protein
MSLVLRACVGNPGRGMVRNRRERDEERETEITLYKLYGIKYSRLAVAFIQTAPLCRQCHAIRRKALFLCIHSLVVVVKDEWTAEDNGKGR